MSTSGPDETPPPSELQGLDPKDLLKAGLDTVPPITLPPQPADPDATLRVAGPSQPSAPQVELPLPEELTHLLPGGNYHVESFLGQGGMGAVYKGMQVRLKRPVAIKIMRRDMGKDYDFEARFEREAQAMAKLNHPNIVSVIDFGEAGADYLYIVMELIDGADLMDVIRGGQMTQEMALTLLPQVCDALQFAHDHGIVHRDIKPSNIMLTRDGRVKMCDFGLAKRYDVESSFRTQTGTGMGTPDYAAPEQFDPKANIDHRADIYALGVMIYQMITGQLPRGVWKPPSQRAEISPQWDDIVSRAMQSDPSDRYQHASDIKTDVSSIPLAAKSDAGTPARKESAAGDKPRSREANVRITSESPPTKSRAPLIFGLLVGAAVIAVGAFFALKKPEESRRGLQTAEEAPSTSDIATPIATPPRALASAPTPPLHESGWKPLFTEKEWRQEEKGVREYKNEMLHLTESIFKKVQPHADGGIRSRIVFQEKSVVPGLVARLDSEGSGYKFVIAEDGKTTGLNRVTRKNNYQKLAQHRLAKPIQFGDKVTLELHALGNRLVAWVDGTPVIDLHDDGILAAGSWGIGAGDGWFESVEVQSLPAVSVSPSPSLPDSTSSATKATKAAPFTSTLGMKFVPVPTDSLKDMGGGWREVTQSSTIRVPITSTQGLIQVRCRRTESSAIDIVAIDPQRIELRLGSKGIHLHQWVNGGTKPNSPGIDLEAPLISGSEVMLQLAWIGDQAHAWVDGRRIASRELDRSIGAPARILIRTDKKEQATWFKDLMTLSLDGSAPAQALAEADKAAQAAMHPLSASSAATATKAAPFVNSLGMKFVPVPGTQVLFSIWHTRVQDYAEYAKENPNPGTLWKQQKKDGVPFGHEPNHPVCGPSWDDAQAFCQWLTNKEAAAGALPKGARYRLPTDAEWSTAVGLPPEQGKTPAEKNGKNDTHFPWGTEWPPKEKVGNYADESFHTVFQPAKRERDGVMVNQEWLQGYDDGFATTSPVGSFPPNAHGLHDMGGNLWQWCEDLWTVGQQERVLRGGTWASPSRDYVLSSRRHHADPTSRGGDGFRCVLELAPSTAAVSPAPNLPVSKSSVATATKDAPFINSLGMKFVPVPITGGPTNGQRVLFSVWETRVRDMTAFVIETKHGWAKAKSVWQEEKYPALGVSLEDANAFCTWLTQREREAGRLASAEAYRLPSDHEWSCAIGITTEKAEDSPEYKGKQAQQTYPWGDTWPPPADAGNFSGAEIEGHKVWPEQVSLPEWRDAFPSSATVGSFPANRFGLHDLSGNAYEWCADLFAPGSSLQVLRGSSFVDSFQRRLASSFRLDIPGKSRRPDSGFRVVIAPVAN